jgi:outer membrane protein
MTKPRTVSAMASLAGGALALSTLLGAAARAEGPTAAASEPLTLSAAVSRALHAAPPVVAARAAEEAARAQLLEAEADRVPALNLTGSAFRHSDPMLTEPIHAFRPTLLPGFDRTIFLGDLQLTYALWDGGLRGARIAQRREQLASATAAAAGVEGEAGARVVAAYFTRLTLDEQLHAHDERKAALAVERARVQKLLDVGRAAQVDLLRVQAAQAAAEADRAAVASERERAGRDLARLLGEGPAAPAPGALAPAALAEPTPPARDAILDQALAASPDVLRSRRDLAAAEAVVRGARAARAPSLRAEGNVLGYGAGNGDSTAEWNAGVRVALPIWDRHVGARIAIAEAGRESAAAAVSLAENQVAGAIDRAWSDLVAAGARAESLGEAEARYAEVERVEALRLATGVGVEADYLRAEADLVAARAAAIEARNRVAAARAELARASGELSQDWIDKTYVVAPAPAAAAPEGGAR